MKVSDDALGGPVARLLGDVGLVRANQHANVRVHDLKGWANDMDLVLIALSERRAHCVELRKAGHALMDVLDDAAIAATYQREQGKTAKDRDEGDLMQHLLHEIARSPGYKLMHAALARLDAMATEDAT